MNVFKKICLRGLTVLSALILFNTASAQVEGLNPSDMFFTVYNYEKEGKRLLQEGEFDNALEKFSKAKKLLTSININFASWNPRIVTKAHDRITELSKTVEAQKLAKIRAVPDGPGLIPAIAKSGRVDAVKARVDKQIKELGLQERVNRVKETEVKLAESQAALQKLKESEATRAGLLQMLKEKDAELVNARAAADSKNTKADQKSKRLQEEIEALRKQVEAMGTQTSFLQQDKLLGDKQAEITAMRKQAELASAKIARLEKYVAEGNEILAKDTEKSELIAKLRDEASVLETAKTQAETRLEAVMLQTESSERNGSENLAQVVALEKEIARLAGQYEKKLGQKEAEIIALKTVEATEGAPSEELLAAKNTLAQAKQRITALQKQVEGVESEEIRVLKADILALQQERELLVMRPKESEILTLKDDLKEVRAEKAGLTKALGNNHEKYLDAVDRIDALQKELASARTITNEFEKNVNNERDISNEIISSQRDRLAESTKKLTETERALAQEKSKASKLQILLDQAQGQYADLDQRHNSLLAEHEHLRTMLSGSTEVNYLRRQQVELKKKYEKSRADYELLLNDSNAVELDLALARKQYALVRADLNKARHEIELSTMQADKLRNELIVAQSDIQLAASNPNSEYSEEEIKLLRDLVNQQVKLQENRQMTRTIILDLVKALNIDDTDFVAALDLAETQEIIYTTEQKKLLAPRDADSEFSFEDHASPEERAQAAAEMAGKIAVYDKLGRETYGKGSYAAAEEFFMLNLDENPGHVPSMMNLGVSRLRHAKEGGGTTEDVVAAIESFEDAISLSPERSLPYAHQMLGYSHYLLKDYDEATKQFFVALDLDAKNAVAHVYLANLSIIKNDLKATESHLKSAIEIDATLYDADYNLAVIYSKQGKYKKSLEHYRSALRKGASPDPDLEKALNKALVSNSL